MLDRPTPQWYMPTLASLARQQANAMNGNKYGRDNYRAQWIVSDFTCCYGPRVKRILSYELERSPLQPEMTDFVLFARLIDLRQDHFVILTRFEHDLCRRVAEEHSTRSTMEPIQAAIAQYEQAFHNPMQEIPEYEPETLASPELIDKLLVLLGEMPPAAIVTMRTMLAMQSTDEVQERIYKISAAKTQAAYPTAD